MNQIIRFFSDQSERFYVTLERFFLGHWLQASHCIDEDEEEWFYMKESRRKAIGWISKRFSPALLLQGEGKPDN